MKCLLKKFHTPNSNGSLVTAIKPKTKYSLHVAMFFIFLKKRELNKSRIFWKICYRTLFQYFKLSGATVAPISKIRASAMLLLPTVG
jgi:hypothetical protein